MSKNNSKIKGMSGTGFMGSCGAVLLSVLIGFLFIQAFSGCGSEWEKKLIRKHEKKSPPPRFEVETVNRAYVELYKEHFLYWKAWQDELINDLGGNPKKVRRDVLETRRHLNALGKYVDEETQKKVSGLVSEFDRIAVRLNNNLLNSNDYGMIKRDFDTLRRRVHRSLKFDKIKNVLKPTPVDMDLSKYEGSEPVVAGVAPNAELEDEESLKNPAADADTPTDAAKPLTYDAYRERSLK